jgi:hypothetical protein
MKYIIGIILLTTLALTAFGEEDHVRQASTEMVSMIKKPTTAIELVENIKYMLDHHFLLDNEFYNDDTLKHFFGGEKIQWHKNDPQKMSLQVLEFGEMFEPQRLNGKTYEGITLNIDRVIHDDGTIDADVRLFNHSVTRLGFDEMKKIFGAGWRPYLIPSPHSIPLSPTRNNGNADIIYENKDVNSKRAIDLKFDPDANLEYASFYEGK